MTTISTLFLLAGLLLFISVLASTISARFGLPLLLLFLIVGMLAGEDGPGGIAFDDFFTASAVGQLALAVILLDGGLRTQASSFRVALKPASLLATWGVICTTGVLGIFATWFLDVDWRFGLLLAAIVGSTDAAAVFALLRDSGAKLSERVKATLEIESGANDPMAILLVTILIEMLLHPERASVGRFALMLLTQAGLGLGLGYAGGWILSRLLIRLNMAEGLYALLILSGGLLVFGATNLLDGSGFLAVYIVGIMIGNRRSHSTEHVLRVMDGLAWLAQAGMFVVLGLLVTPSHVLEYSGEALAMALVLMLVARPLAVATGLLPFKYAGNEIAFVSWVGLRGAVPVVLAIFPVVMGVPNSRLLFDVAFAVVLLSLLVQGTTIPWVARMLKVTLPPTDDACDQRELWVAENAVLHLFAYQVAEGSDATDCHPDQVARETDKSIRCIALVRHGQLHELENDTRLRVGDLAWFIAPAELSASLAGTFGSASLDIRRNAGFFGELAVAPDSPSRELAATYGLELSEHELSLPLREVVLLRLKRPAVVGDRIPMGHLTLVVRKLDAKGTIGLIGLKFPAATRHASRAD